MSVNGHETVRLTDVLISARSCASLRQRPAAVSASLSHARAQKDASNTDLLVVELSIAPNIEMRVPRLFIVSAVCTAKSASRSVGS